MPTKNDEGPSDDASGRATRTLLLAALFAGACLAGSFLVQPALSERPWATVDVWLSVDPTPFTGVEWGDGTLGPGGGLAAAERLLFRITAGALLAFGIVGALGHLALAGSAAVARRFELRLRRALGAPRRNLVEALARKGVRVMVASLPLGAAGVLMASAALDASWLESFPAPPPALRLLTIPAALGVVAVIAWGLVAFLVVQSGEALPGRPLHRRASLGEPFRGEVCHPGVPVLQIAACVAVLASVGMIVRGPELTSGPAPPTGRQDVPRVLVELGGEREASAAAGAQAGVALTSPGFWESLGQVRYAETECGRCFHPGSPPVPAPYKGEPAVHHAVSPDTFELAGIVMVQGRSFSPSDDHVAAPVAVVSRTFARANFERGEALGRRVRIGAGRGPNRARWHTVVGVVEPLPRGTLASRSQPAEDVLVPVAQLPPERVEVAAARLSDLLGATAGLAGPGAAVTPLPSTREGVEAIREWTGWYADLWRTVGRSTGLLALIGVGLTVARRVREESPELALRRAVGATRSRIVLRYTAFGLRIGVLGAVVGSWASLFVLGVMAPAAFGAPGVLAVLLLPPAAGLTATAAGAATLAAAAGLRGSPREGMADR